MSRMKFFMILLAVVFVIGTVGSVYATSPYFNNWKAAYPNSATSSFSCSICHTSPPTLNGYGKAVLAANFNFKSIESQDSDGDKASNIAEITAGTNPGSASSTPPPPATACTGYTYSAWSACGTDGQQTRTTTGNTPAGCTGTPSTSPLLTQSCTPSPVACTSYTYSAWSACQANNTQTRTVVSSSPSGCTGTPLLTQICNYVPPPTPTPPPSTPPPVSQIMEVPAGEQVFSYNPVELPVLSGDPAQAKPIGVGPAASGGNTIDVNVNIGPFAGPVNVSMVVYAPAVDSGDLYFMSPASGLIRVSDALYSGDENSNDDTIPITTFSKLLIWQSSVTGVDGNVYTGPTLDLPSGLYTLVLVVNSPDNDENYYRWITHLIIP